MAKPVEERLTELVQAALGAQLLTIFRLQAERDALLEQLATQTAQPPKTPEKQE